MSRTFSLVLLVASLAGCALVRLQEDARDFYSSTVIAGRVLAPGGAGPVVVAAREVGSGRVVHHTMLQGPAEFELMVPHGRYEVVAFRDADGNGRFDAGEASGRAAALVEVDARSPGVIAPVDVSLGAPPALEVGVAFAARRPTEAGRLASLDEPALSAEGGRLGWWSPMAYFREVGGNIVFLEPYDPARTPVLFIHGAGGSPQDWRAFVESLDRTRFQAWLYHYPSGASLDAVSHLLYWKLFNLRLRHPFERVHLTAHSMGGLVARRFLVDHGAQFPHVGAFVTLSTPWGGESTADLGVRHSPAVIPAWRDLRPEGDFLRTLFDAPMPKGVEHYLLFGHRGGVTLVRPNNDGAVTLASQLRSEAQAAARQVMGFDADHVGILASREVLARHAAILDAAGGPRAGAGRLEVRLGPEGAAAGALPLVLLAPATGGERRYVPARAGQDGRIVVSAPPGDYEASVIAGGWRAQPRRVPVRIAADGPASASFHLRPEGELAGYVGLSADGALRPAGRYSAPDGEGRLRRVRLLGPGVRRELVPGSLGLDACVDRVLDGQDCATGAYFAFTGLPEGEYRLEIEADGRRPHASRHAVKPGRAGPALAIELEPS